MDKYQQTKNIPNLNFIKKRFKKCQSKKVVASCKDFKHKKPGHHKRMKKLVSKMLLKVKERKEVRKEKLKNKKLLQLISFS